MITNHDNVTVEILSDINVTFHNGIERSHMDATALKTQDTWLEESFRRTETLVADSDDLPVGELIGFFQTGALAGGLDFLLEVKGDITQLFLHITDNLTLRGG